MSNNNTRFQCLKTSTDNKSYEPPNNKKTNSRPNRFSDGRQHMRENSRWKRSNSPPKNNFRGAAPSHTNSRWKMMQDEYKPNNSFRRDNKDRYTANRDNYRRNDRDNYRRNDRDSERGGGGRRRGRYSGFGKNRKYLGRGGPSIFDGVEIDSNGLPKIAGSTQKTFDIMASLQKPKPQKKRKNKTPKKNLVKLEKKRDFSLMLKKEEKTEEELRKEKEWQKAMLMQYQMYTDSEEEHEDDDEVE